MNCEINFEPTEEFFTKQGRSGGTKCCICKKWIQLPRKRKNEIPTWLTECDDCEIQDPLQRAFHKMNKELSDEERESVNEFHRQLWNLGDRLRELSHAYDIAKIYQGKGDELIKTLSKMPWLEK